MVPKTWAFSLEEYQTRVARTQSAMSSRGLDVLFLRHRADICYLTGMETCYMVAYHAALLPIQGEPALIASDFEMLNALPVAWCKDRITFPVRSVPLETVCRTLHERGFSAGRIGVELNTLSAADFRTLQQALPHATLVSCDDLLPSLKAIKSAAEIDYLRQAGRLSQQGLAAAIAVALPGNTDNDVAAAAYTAMVRGGGEFMCIEPIVTVGGRSGIPHTTFRRTRIEPGQSVLIEVGGCVCRYSAPLMQTVLTPPVSPAMRQADDASRASLAVLLEKMRPGAIAREVATRAKAAWSPLCDQLIWHGIYAYSVGIGFPPDWNDAPLCVTEDADFVLEPGMCFHTTTSLRQAAEFGVANSETVLITETGNEILTRS